MHEDALPGCIERNKSSSASWGLARPGPSSSEKELLELIRLEGLQDLPEGLGSALRDCAVPRAPYVARGE